MPMLNKNVPDYVETLRKKGWKISESKSPVTGDISYVARRKPNLVLKDPSYIGRLSVRLYDYAGRIEIEPFIKNSDTPQNIYFVEFHTCNDDEPANKMWNPMDVAYLFQE